MIPLPPYQKTYSSSSLSRGFWFEAPADFVITGLRVPTDVGNEVQNLCVVKYSVPVPTSCTNPDAVLGYWTNVSPSATVATNIFVTAGDVIGIIGTRGTSTMKSSYGTSNTFASTILGQPVTLKRFMYQENINTTPPGCFQTSSSLELGRVEVFYEAPVFSNDDAGIASVDGPVNFCAGNMPVDVTLTNYGGNQLTSATINWEINGQTQTPYTWTGVLDTTDFNARTTQVTIGNYNFQSGVPYSINAWTSDPNGKVDTDNSNDGATLDTKSAISGEKTIGGSSPDYATFNDAAADLLATGVCGPVVFKVRTGNYNEQVTFEEIPGASAVNTITFESETGARNDVTLSFAASSSSANWVLHLDGADFFTFQNMTLEATGAGSYGRVMEVENEATNNTFNNLVFNGRNENSTSTNYAVVYSTNGLDNYTTFQNCLFNEGSQAMYWEGDGTSTLESGIVLENNTYMNYYDEGLYISYQDGIRIEGNTFITNSTYSGQEQMYLRYCDNALRVIGNTVNVGPVSSGTKTGIYLYYCDGNTGNPGLIANNFVTIQNGSGTAYGIYPDQADYQRIFFNTVHVKSSSSSTRALYSEDGIDLHYMNNIFVNTGSGYAVYTDNTSSIVVSDFNVFYTTGSNIGYWGGARATLADWQNGSGLDANTIDKLPVFANAASGDLHLTGISEDDPDLTGTLLPEVTVDIDGESRVRPYRGADEACYIIDNTVTFELSDANGMQAAYMNVPGSVGVHYYVAFPDFDANINITLNFYSVTTSTLEYTTSFSVSKLQGQILDGIHTVPVASVPAGYYRVEAVFNTKNSCGGYRDYSPTAQTLMILPQGQTPCIVWPGDSNNDGIVNYGDRKALNQYIQDANLSPLWLNGPARYRADANGDPLAFLRWEPQAAMPWNTAEGCHMDTDGNGVVNTFDYIGYKMNWMRDHVATSPKPENQFSTITFDMNQNFPNPFNPTTQIQFSVPERSDVQIVVLDMLGRTVATLASSIYQSGVHTATFDASGLSSGTYTAIATMTGKESGLSFTKTIRMNLTK